MPESTDFAVIGAGIVGLATAYTLLRRQPGISLTVLEKEAEVGRHQTGHNSGVIHAGAYYRPGSLKARLCRRGRELLLGYLEQHTISYKILGKVIVATRSRELTALREIHRRALANGLNGVRELSPEGLVDYEPEVRGLGGLLVPETGIVDYRSVARALARDVETLGGSVRTKAGLAQIESHGGGLRLGTRSGEIRARFLVNCAGLYSDEIARMAGCRLGVRIIPFRGEYYGLRPQARKLIRRPVYPVPDPTLPFLGVHFTPTMEGEVEAGPNAVLALAREGYTARSVRLGDFWETVTFPGFAPMAWKFWKTGFYESFRSLSKATFVRDLQRLVPAVTTDDLTPGGTGVRAQAIARDGSLLDDFAFVASPCAIHVVNAPSPGATSSLAIAEEIVSRIPAIN